MSESQMVVEFLTFEVDVALRSEWLRHEEKHWSRFLEEQTGFVRKQIWEDADDPRALHAVIWWESLDAWHSIPKDELARVMAAMGKYELDAALSTFNVIRDC
ncbi:MAG: TIGR03792 family protein [Acidimicrobiaceae bacterium]|nr:TIGR03792 family protein [Acidimicrobiaceae bacterium]